MDFIIDHRADLIIGILGGLITTGIIAAVKPLRKLPPVSVPVWLLAMAIAIPLTFLGAWLYNHNRVESVAYKRFEAERIILDGKRFVECEFDRCVLVFRGKSPFGLHRCVFTAPKIQFESAAALTVFQIRKMRGDPAFKGLEDFLAPLPSE